MFEEIVRCDNKCTSQCCFDIFIPKARRPPAPHLHISSLLHLPRPSIPIIKSFHAEPQITSDEMRCGKKRARPQSSNMQADAEQAGSGPQSLTTTILRDKTQPRRIETETRANTLPSTSVLQTRLSQYHAVSLYPLLLSLRPHSQISVFPPAYVHQQLLQLNNDSSESHPSTR
jgi:hypothetical protein